MSLSRALLFVLAVVLLFGGDAQASAINECIDACFSGYACSFNGGDQNVVCTGARDRCVKQCNDNINGHNDPAPVKGAYGALAYDKDSGAWGMADRSQDKDSAEKSAMDHCSKHGSGCAIVESFSNACAAVASGTGNRFAWSVNEDPKQAGLDAIKKCGDSGSSGNKNDHSRCYMQLYNCYSP